MSVTCNNIPDWCDDDRYCPPPVVGITTPRATPAMPRRAIDFGWLVTNERNVLKEVVNLAHESIAYCTSQALDAPVVDTTGDGELVCMDDMDDVPITTSDADEVASQSSDDFVAEPPLYNNNKFMYT